MKLKITYMVMSVLFLLSVALFFAYFYLPTASVLYRLPAFVGVLIFTVIIFASLIVYSINQNKGNTGLLVFFTAIPCILSCFLIPLLKLGSVWFPFEIMLALCSSVFIFFSVIFCLLNPSPRQQTKSHFAKRGSETIIFALIVIITILMFIPSFWSVNPLVKKIAINYGQMKAFINRLNDYFEQHNQYPETLAELVGEENTCLLAGDPLDKGNYSYGYFISEDKQRCFFISSGPDGVRNVVQYAQISSQDSLDPNFHKKSKYFAIHDDIICVLDSGKAIVLPRLGDLRKYL